MTKKIALVIISDPMIYPPTMNAANILGEKGWKVKLYGFRLSSYEKISPHRNVELIYVGSLKPGIGFFIQYILFIFRLIISVLLFHPKSIIAYDAYAVLPVFIASKLSFTKWIYHQHDYWQNPIGFRQRFMYKVETYLGGKADIITMPQQMRAKFFRERVKKKLDVSIIYNCPRISWSANKSINTELLKIKNTNCNILVFQGGLSPLFDYEKLFCGFSKATSSFVVCFCGKELKEGTLNKMFSAVKKYNMSERFYFLGGIPYESLASVTNYCTIGLANFTYSKNSTINDYYLIGASNKISEYLSSGLPIIAPRTTENIKFFQMYTIGELYDMEDPNSIGRVVDELLNNSQRRKAISEYNKNLFNNYFNYDIQFNKIIKAITDDCNK